MNQFRSEHPNPQWERKTWRNLNGVWEFDFDFGASARDRKLYEQDALDQEIIVPFCPESALSGIGYKDFMAAVCYRRTFTLSAGELGGRVLLHFGAVDYKAYVYVNKKLAGCHIGGYASFCFDITAFAAEGENVVFVIAEDDVRSKLQPRGKQSELYFSHGCDYTRTTGIWQTVWLEFVPETYIKSAKFYPDIQNGTLTVEGEASGAGTVTAAASFAGRPMGSAQAETAGGHFHLQLQLEEVHLWEVGTGRLYDLKLTLGADSVSSYFGMRSLRLDGMKFLINEKSVFQRLVLDQGFYPDGIYTAKDEGAFVKDIEISLAAGFNGARLHQKVFEPRFLYHCDRLGYIVWGEYGNWGMDYTDPRAAENFMAEWIEVVERDFNHPAIVGWCPFNETWEYEETAAERRHGKPSGHRLLELTYKLTKALDHTRPCIDTSGNYHSVTDIFDTHDYTQDVEQFRAYAEQLEKTGAIYDRFWEKQTYRGEPTFVSEYGGIKWDVKGAAEGWGYGEGPQTEQAFIARYKGLTDALLDAPGMFGFCYTQLYDVEQEVNGLYTYEREPKFDMRIFREINSRKAAIED